MLQQLLAAIFLGSEQLPSSLHKRKRNTLKTNSCFQLRVESQAALTAPVGPLAPDRNHDGSGSRLDTQGQMGGDTSVRRARRKTHWSSAALRTSFVAATIWNATDTNVSRKHMIVRLLERSSCSGLGGVFVGWWWLKSHWRFLFLGANLMAAC